MDRSGPDKWQRGSHPLHHVGHYDSQKRHSSLSVDIEKRSLLPDSCLSAACGLRRSKDSRLSTRQIMNASYKFPNHQCSSEERRMRRDSNRLRIRPLKNIEMPIRWITKSTVPITQIFRVEEIFAIFANLYFARNFPPAKIISTANGISRNFPPAKFSSRRK